MRVEKRVMKEVFRVSRCYLFPPRRPRPRPRGGGGAGTSSTMGGGGASGSGPFFLNFSAT
eukprot:24785-Eustigmatos_ZCMA.PRE.1